MPLALFDPDQHAVAVDVGNPQLHDFGDPQPGGVGRHQRFADSSGPAPPRKIAVLRPRSGSRGVAAAWHHPHIHCLVPGGGLSLDGTRWIACRPRFFLPVRDPSETVRRDANRVSFGLIIEERDGMTRGSKG